MQVAWKNNGFGNKALSKQSKLTWSLKVPITHRFFVRVSYFSYWDSKALIVQHFETDTKLQAQFQLATRLKHSKLKTEKIWHFVHSLYWYQLSKHRRDQLKVYHFVLHHTYFHLHFHLCCFSTRLTGSQSTREWNCSSKFMALLTRRDSGFGALLYLFTPSSFYGGNYSLFTSPFDIQWNKNSDGAGRRGGVGVGGGGFEG